MATPTMQHADPRERPGPREVIAVSWRLGYRGYSWKHGAERAVGDPYTPPRKTLCGKRIYDGSHVGSVDDVDCGSCLRVLKRRQAQ